MTERTGTISFTFDSDDSPATIKDVVFYGADPTGVSDSTVAFTSAALAAVAYSNVTDKGADVPKPLNCDVFVPAGKYKLSSKVKTQRRVTWHFDDAAIVDNSYNLDGVLHRSGRTNAVHIGIGQGATTQSSRAGQAMLDVNPEAYGIASQSQLSLYGPLHSVGSFTDNAGQICQTLTGTTFTSTAVTFTNAIDFSDFKPGSSLTVGKGYGSITGFVDSWDAPTKTFSVKGWYLYNATVDSKQTPTNGSAVLINYFDKIWAHNANVVMPSGSSTVRGVGFELGTDNGQADVSETFDINAPYVWGFDAVNIGAYKSNTGYIARDNFVEGFLSRGPKYSFRVLPGLSPARDISAVGFSYEQGSGTAFRSTMGGKPSFLVDCSGNFEIGRTDVAQATYIDFHSSGQTVDYDARILATGGSATQGSGDITYVAANHVFMGRVVVGTATLTTGAGSPQGVITAPPGSLYTNTSGGSGTTLYVKESGTGNTGWAAK